MERNLFDWDDWDEMGYLSFLFYNVKLKVNIDPHKIGDEFSSAYVNFEDGELVLHDAGEEVGAYQLSIVVGGPIELH